MKCDWSAELQSLCKHIHIAMIRCFMAGHIIFFWYISRWQILADITVGIILLISIGEG